jgi:hypothetical protein
LSTAWRTGQFDRGCVKSRRKNANDLTDENFSRFFYFRSTSDLENKPRPAACENSAEFLHSLDPELPFKGDCTNGREARESGRWPNECLRQSGSFFRWRAQRDFRHHWVRTRATSASQYPLDDFLGTSRSTALKSRSVIAH